ncbi:MAG: indolepyruvate ferredoxin oxidoreductase subunit alpha, partial [Candidatus Lindowbacteria bacterium]|nr:indolepyruvate ferredoxin oxidoreductase subunit alpha [Candidatus Lindowbacteria bacterium]
MSKVLMSGNEAAARGAYEAGVRFAASYPGTPATEVLENVSTYAGVRAQWTVNEKVALEETIGAAVAGARAMASMKHVGMNVAADPLFTASYIGVKGGLVIVNADDPGMHSSQNEQDNRYYARAAKLLTLEPADSAETKEFVRLAFDLSEQYDTPVIVRMTTRISHSKGLVALGERVEKEVEGFKRDIPKYVMLPGYARGRHVVVEERMKRLAELSDRSELNRIIAGDRALGIISSGAAFQYSLEVAPKASFLKLGIVNPLPKEMIKRFAAQVENLVVVEELDPVIEEQVRALGLKVYGKDLGFPLCGELSPEAVWDALHSKFPQMVRTRHEVTVQPGKYKDIPPRPPVLCPGCSHRIVLSILKKFKVNIMGDIGCYTLAAQPPLNAMDSCVCMGASVGMAFGVEKVSGKGKAVAALGDSTFIHGGITGLIDIVYNKGATLVMILDNCTTAMTGRQDHPATGKTLQGEPTIALDFEKLARGIGILESVIREVGLKMASSPTRAVLW